MGRRYVRAHVHRSRARRRRKDRARGRRIRRRHGRRERERERARPASSSDEEYEESSSSFHRGTSTAHHSPNTPVYYETTHRTPPLQTQIKLIKPINTSTPPPRRLHDHGRLYFIILPKYQYNTHHIHHHERKTHAPPRRAWRRPAAPSSRRHIDVARGWRRVRREPRRRPKSCTTTRMISFRGARAPTRARRGRGDDDARVPDAMRSSRPETMEWDG